MLTREAANRKGAALKVLAIEDSDADFRMVERALEDEFLLSRSSSLSGGLDLAINEGIDLILLDLTLEDSSGFATFRRARPRAAGSDLGVERPQRRGACARCVSRGAGLYPQVPASRLPAESYCPIRHRTKRDQDAAAESERFARATVDALAPTLRSWMKQEP